jgi:hypothetical protein
LACYAEQIVWSAGPLELATGLSARYPEGVMPYTALALYFPEWWAVLEVGARVPNTQFAFAVSFGVRW